MNDFGCFLHAKPDNLTKPHHERGDVKFPAIPLPIRVYRPKIPLFAAFVGSL
jgi:hypothetical protein